MGSRKNHTEITVFRCKPDVRTFRADRRHLFGAFAQNNRILDRICAIRRQEGEVHEPFMTNLYKSTVSSEWMLQHECRVDVHSCIC